MQQRGDMPRSLEFRATLRKRLQGLGLLNLSLSATDITVKGQSVLQEVTAAEGEVTDMLYSQHSLLLQGKCHLQQGFFFGSITSACQPPIVSSVLASGR